LDTDQDGQRLALLFNNKMKEIGGRSQSFSSRPPADGIIRVIRAKVIFYRKRLWAEIITKSFFLAKSSALYSSVCKLSSISCRTS
jgi:hypothetical protein